MSNTRVQSVQCRATVSVLITLSTMLASSVSFAAAGSAASASAPTGRASAAAKQATPARLVDINSASAKELKTLPGIGDAEATKIIANRPYLTKVDLVTKKVLPQGPYVALKDQVVAMQKGPPPKPKP